MVRPFLALVGLAPSVYAQCDSTWDSAFGLPAGADVQAVTTCDFDGDGPQPVRLGCP